MKKLLAIAITIVVMVVLLKVISLILSGLFALAKLVIVLIVGYLVYQTAVKLLKAT